MQEKLQDKGSARRAASKPPNDAPKSPANSFSSAKKVMRAMRISRALHLRGVESAVREAELYIRKLLKDR